MFPQYWFHESSANSDQYGQSLHCLFALTVIVEAETYAKNDWPPTLHNIIFIFNIIFVFIF